MKIIALIATRPRYTELLSTSLPSIVNQTRKPDEIVIVTDRKSLSAKEKLTISLIVAPIKTTIIANNRTAGAAGSWNTGLLHIAEKNNKAYIAILDDDDNWDATHLSTCEAVARRRQSDVVISGIRMVVENGVVKNGSPTPFKRQDFLIGNPGWQGSNTFAKHSALMRAGGFRDGLLSSNDRDLALRVFALKNLQIDYSNSTTVSWNYLKCPDALSRPGGVEKLTGAAQFFALYKHEMTSCQESDFFARMNEYFGLEEQQILALQPSSADLPKALACITTTQS